MFDMSSQPQPPKKKKGPNYSFNEDRILLDLLIQHADEVGLYDKVRYAWSTRFNGKDVQTYNSYEV